MNKKNLLLFALMLSSHSLVAMESNLSSRRANIPADVQEEEKKGSDLFAVQQPEEEKGSEAMEGNSTPRASSIPAGLEEETRFAKQEDASTDTYNFSRPKPANIPAGLQEEAKGFEDVLYQAFRNEPSIKLFDLFLRVKLENKIREVSQATTYDIDQLSRILPTDNGEIERLLAMPNKEFLSFLKILEDKRNFIFENPEFKQKLIDIASYQLSFSYGDNLRRALEKLHNSFPGVGHENTETTLKTFFDTDIKPLIKVLDDHKNTYGTRIARLLGHNKPEFLKTIISNVK